MVMTSKAVDACRQTTLTLSGAPSLSACRGQALANYDYEQRHADELTVIYGLRRAATARKS